MEPTGDALLEMEGAQRACSQKDGKETRLAGSFILGKVG